MDLAFERARESGADLILANDPDADRLAVAIPADVEGGWRRLTGNEVGLLLGWRAAQRAAASREGAAPDADVPAPSLACSLVSSPGLGAIAERYGLGFHETLTGFKWISRAPGIVFGFEEALGYLVDPDVVRDKDGISAALAALELAATEHANGSGLAGLLARFEAEFGSYASDQISVRVDDLGIIARIMASLRADQPGRIGEIDVASVDDLLTGVDGLPPGDVLRYRLTDGSRLVVRPSGTEPKLKLYLDVHGNDTEESAARLAALADGARALLAERG